jgi:hypothetical protein
MRASIARRKRRLQLNFNTWATGQMGKGSTWHVKQDAVSETTGATGEGPGALKVFIGAGGEACGISYGLGGRVRWRVRQ